jgi:hypothetical protein
MKRARVGRTARLLPALSATGVVVVPEWRTSWSAHPRIARVNIEGAYLSVLRSGDGRVSVLPGPADLPPPVSSPGAVSAATEKQAPPKPSSTQAAASTESAAQQRLRLRIAAPSASVIHLAVPGLVGRSAVVVSGTVPAAPGRSPPRGGAATFMGLPRDAARRPMADRAGRIPLDFVLRGRPDDPSFLLSEVLATRTASIVGSLGIGVEDLVRGAEAAGQNAIDAAAGALRRLFGR